MTIGFSDLSGAVSKPLRLPHNRQFELQKSVPRHCEVQISRSTTSQNAPKLTVFKNFDFGIAMSLQRGANFADPYFKKCSEAASFS